MISIFTRLALALALVWPADCSDRPEDARTENAPAPAQEPCNRQVPLNKFREFIFNN
jgi:hypothetical protein